MHVVSLHCDGVRNLVDVRVEPHRRLTVFVGDNGQGKTNVLEALHLAAGLRPLRALERASDLVGFGRERGVVQARFEIDGPLDVEVVVEPRGRKATLAGKAVRDVGEVAQRIGVVTFVPEDASFVRGGPEQRRRGLDRFAFGLTATHGALARRYDEALARRNRVLKAAVVDEALLDAYTDPLVQAGVALTRARHHAASLWAPVFAREAEAIGGTQLAAHLRYESALLDDAHDVMLDEGALLDRFHDALKRARASELKRRSTATGPHLDDVALLKADRKARHLASQGEARALVLALKIAAVRLTTTARGTGPLLLLDDVAGELDPEKAQRLLRAVDECAAQTFVTVTHTAALPPLGDARVFRVQQGRVVVDREG
jgi:DNA replication and repair protein RecF